MLGRTTAAVTHFSASFWAFQSRVVMTWKPPVVTSSSLPKMRISSFFTCHVKCGARNVLG